MQLETINITRKMQQVLKSSHALIILACMGLFSIFYLPSLGSVPYLDGNIDLIRSYDFYSGGFTNYFQKWGSVHPPLKLFISNLLFKTFGVNVFSYNIIGFVLGLLGLFFIYRLCESIFNRKTAAIAIFLLSTCPLFISTGIFSLTDYLVSIFIIISLNFYSQKKYFLYGLFCSFSVLTKETALLFPTVVILIELIFSLNKITKIGKNLKLFISKTACLISPFIVYSAWSLFLKSNGQQAWNDWNFSSTASSGSIYTIINNLITFGFLNKYAFQNWQELFILNFNWIICLILFAGLAVFILKNFKTIKDIVSNPTQSVKSILIIILFTTFYILTVLSFQTYTIPRYGLPAVVFLLIGASWTIGKLLEKANPTIKVLFIAILTLILAARLFSSIDPISIKLWGITNILNNNFYALNQHLAGNDGITYNMQYVFIAEKRSNALKNANGFILSNQCNWMFPDPNNDYKTIKILNLKINTNNPCISTYGNN